MGPALIHEYGIIGNGRSAALVGPSGSIDWLCWPRFDSPSLLAALVDGGTGGHFSITPTAPFTVTRAYEHESNVLVTTFTTADGEIRLTDLMPVMSEEDKATTLFPEHEILRVCACVRGRVELRLEFHPASRLRAPRRSDPRHPPPRLPDRGRTAPLHVARRSAAGADRRHRRRGPLHAGRRRARDGLAGVRPRGARGAAAAGSRGRPPSSARIGVVAAVGVALHLRRALPPRGHPQRAGAQAARLRALGRDRGRADDVAARADRRRSQLGLPLLLDP